MKPTNGRRSHSEKGYIDSVLSTKRPRSICSGQLAPKFAVPCGLTGCVLIPWSHNLGHRTPVFSGWTLPYGDSNLWVVFSTSHALHHAQGLCSVARRGCVGWATQTFLLHCFIQLESHYPQVSLLSFWFSFYYYYTGHIFYFTLPL